MSGEKQRQTEVEGTPTVLDYVKPAKPTGSLCSVAQHFVVVGCGCFLAILHFSWVIGMDLSRFYFPRPTAARNWHDKVYSIITMPMALLHIVGLEPADSRIGFVLAVSNSLLWGLGIAYLIFWLIRFLKHQIQ